MGNAALRDIAAIETVSFDSLEGSTVAIDAHNWLYRYLTTTVRWTDDDIYTTDSGTEVANLVGIVQGLPKFFEHDLQPVFVFDGHVTELKDDEIEDRREARENREEQLEAAREAGDPLEVARLESSTQRLTETIHETTRELLEILDVPIVNAPAEGEAQAAQMARTGDVDFAGTEDYDALLFGSPQTLRGLTSTGDPERMSFEKTLEEHEITWEQLVDIALLCGTDFNDGIHGYGPKTSVKAIREHGNLASVLEADGEHIEYAEKIQSLFLDPDVTGDYSVDGVPDPDLEAAREYVCEQWEINSGEVERGFERMEASMVQTGLDQWT